MRGGRRRVYEGRETEGREGGLRDREGRQRQGEGGAKGRGGRLREGKGG